MSTELMQWSVADIETMAATVAKSRLFPMDAAQAFTLMMLADAEGIHPVKALQRYHVIQGRPAMKADAMLADFLKIGGTVEWITESDDREKCEAIFRHPTFCPKGKAVRFSLADAKTAGIAGKDNWKNYAPAMLRARVISSGVRMIAPGIVAGLYTPEEVADFAPVQTIASCADKVTTRSNRGDVGPIPAVLDLPYPPQSDPAPPDPDPAPPSREPGSDDVRTTKEPVRHAKPWSASWFDLAAERQGATEWFTTYGRKHGFPNALSEWSKIMYDEAVKARAREVESGKETPS